MPNRSSRDSGGGWFDHNLRRASRDLRRLSGRADDEADRLPRIAHIIIGEQGHPMPVVVRIQGDPINTRNIPGLDQATVGGEVGALHGDKPAIGAGRSQ